MLVAKDSGLRSNSRSLVGHHRHPGMMSGRHGFQPRFSPSNRTSELAQHKTSKAVWATTPCGKLSWGDQEPMWPLTASALGARPSERTQHLARPRGDHRRKEEASFSRMSPRPSSEASRYERIVRLSTPRTRSCSRPPQPPQWDPGAPVRHAAPSIRTAVVTPRLLRLSIPKTNHPDFRSDRESVASVVSFASRTARVTQRLVQLSLPRLKRSGICLELGRPVEPIWTVSKAALRATASARVEMLAAPKRLSEDYIPPREPEWTRTSDPPS